MIKYLWASLFCGICFLLIKIFNYNTIMIKILTNTFKLNAYFCAKSTICFAFQVWSVRYQPFEKKISFIDLKQMLRWNIFWLRSTCNPTTTTTTTPTKATITTSQHQQEVNVVDLRCYCHKCRRWVNFSAERCLQKMYFANMIPPPKKLDRFAYTEK